MDRLTESLIKELCIKPTIKVIRRYSEPFKLKILDELTTGKLSNKYQLGKAYGIAPTTINEWIKKYNRKDLMNTSNNCEN